MQYYEGRVYIGCGDYWENQGPIDVWSLAPDGDTAEFNNELRVDEEMVNLFRSYGGRLYIPGMDATEPWDLGNYYYKESGVWTKRRTVPNGLHVDDIAEYAGGLYLRASTESCSGVYESFDDGMTWHWLVSANFDSSASWFGYIATVNGSLLIMAHLNDTACILRYAGGVLDTLMIPVYPGQQWGGAYRLIQYQDGVVYTTGSLWSTAKADPLYFLNDFANGARRIDGFGDDSTNGVRDIFVRDDSCFVLTATAQGDSFRGRVHSTANLTDWKVEADFVVPALPYSIEYLNGSFYVGLGCRAWQGNVADRASGSIWRIGKTH